VHTRGAREEESAVQGGKRCRGHEGGDGFGLGLGFGRMLAQMDLPGRS